MKKHIGAVILLWLLAICASFAWGAYTNSIQSKDQAVKTGRAFFKLISVSRYWNAAHGGVYVPITPETTPNPFLPAGKQVLTCANNTQLTLINPALMTAQFSKISLRSEGISFRLVSLDPTNPENRANHWEESALKAFKQNAAQEITAFTTRESTPMLNYIAPLYIQTQCLQCHTTQGYTIGDIAGGISLSAPIHKDKMSAAFVISHLSAAFFGIVILLTYGTLLQRSQEQLIQEKNKAEQANQAKSTFLATMSHELRTPLSGIIGMTGILQTKTLDKKFIQPLEDIESAAQSLITIINDILDFSKLEVQKLALTEESFHLDELCRKCIRLITPLANHKALKLHYTLDRNIPPWLRGDPLRLRQIILNLLQNSVKFTPAGSIHLTVSLQKETIAKTLLTFAITDTGIGLSPAEQETLFTPYQQGDSSTARKYGGTGLGLFICQQLTSLMHGTIWIESSKQSGTTFFFTAELRRSTPPKATPFRTPNCHLGRLKTILLADDSVINRKVLNKILSDHGYECTCVVNGQEALNLAAVKRYDIILLDSRMPELDGPSTCIGIRNTEYGPTTPILALTADITEQEHGLCLEAGMDDVIIKPVDPATLVQTIEELITQYASPEDRQKTEPSPNV